MVLDRPAERTVVERDAPQPGMSVHETVRTERYEQVALSWSGCDEQQVASHSYNCFLLAYSFETVAVSQHKKA